LVIIVTSYNSTSALIWCARNTLATIGVETIIAIFVLQIIQNSSSDVTKYLNPSVFNTLVEL
jgi:hypothetical protein